MTSWDIDTIRYPGEKGAFFVLLLASLLPLAVLVLVLVNEPATALGILFYVGMYLFISWLGKIFAMASIRGYGIRVTEKQYPQIHEYAQQFAARLGLNKAPEVYVIQATLIATKVIGRRYVILYSHLVDAALESGDSDEVAMILGHEMAHHAAGHVRWSAFLRLGSWIPFLYFYWSRRAEYTCDRAGLLLVNKLQPALQGIVNAFATKVIGRRYVILYSHLVDAALESGDSDEVAMILGHEMAHHAAGHVRWSAFLRLGSWIPFLYFYWSRRAEYTCDRAGLLLVNKLQPALQGIVKLAVGRKLAASTSLAAVREQKEQVSREIGPKIVEIFSTHPLTIKRLTAMEDFQTTGMLG